MSYTFTMSAFEVTNDDKEQALKVLEEASEVVAAWKDGYKKSEMVEECIDVVQAVVNLLDACHIPQEAIDAYILQVRRKNEFKGRTYAETDWGNNVSTE